MSNSKILQSMLVLHYASMNTYEAVIADGKPALRQQGTDTLITDLSTLEDVMIVLPVAPRAGDVVATYYEGELLMGVIEPLRDNGLFGVDLGEAGIFELSRNQFHVVEAVGSDIIIEETQGTQLVVISSRDENFPVGTKATLAHVTTTRAVPPVVIPMVTNNLGWTWDATGVNFRLLDPTVVDFDFAEEVTQLDPSAFGALVDESSVDDSSIDALTQLFPILGAGETTEGFLVDNDIKELGNEHFGFTITDAEGNSLQLDDLPEEVRAAITRITTSMTGEAVEPQKAPVPDLGFPYFNVLGSLFSDLFGIISKEAEEKARQDRLETITKAAFYAQNEHEDFVQDAHVEISDHMGEATKKLSLAMNLLNRTISLTTDVEAQRSLGDIAVLLAESRNDIIEASKAQLDLTTDIHVNGQLQEGFAKSALALH